MFNELRLTYLFVRRDLSASLIPALLLAMSAVSSSAPHSFAEVACLLAYECLYFSAYIYCFCLANQIVGVEEDRINKPDRPLPAGLVALAAVKARWGLAMLLFPLIGWCIGGWGIARWALAWQAILVAYNWGKLDKHWVTKNFVFITFGTFVLLCPAWEIVQPLSATPLRWVIVIAALFGATLHLQDLRDIAGDQATGRKTLPLAIGETKARVVLAIAIGTLPLLVHWALLRNVLHTPARLALEVALSAINLWVAVRVLALRAARHDHKTYMLHTYWFCCILGSAGVMLRPALRVDGTMSGADGRRFVEIDRGSPP